MTPLRRQFLRLAAGVAALPAITRVTRAQSYPSRPISMVVPVSAGGAMDVLARIVAEGMRASLGQPVIVDNVTGASGTIGVAGSPAQHLMAIPSVTLPSPRMSSAVPFMRCPTTCLRILPPLP